MGLGNYLTILRDDRFWQSLGHTAFFAVISVAVELVLGLALALAMNRAFRGRGVAEALMRQAEVVAREQGIAVLRIDTNTHNPAMHRLMPKLGYTFAGEIGLAFRPGLRFFCYEKRLPEAQP